MPDMIHLGKNSFNKREDNVTPFFKNIFENDFLLLGNFRVDLKETNDNYIVEADLPGIKKEALNIDYDNNYLIISAKRDEALENRNESYVRRERYYGEFKRSFYLNNVDETRIQASFNDGVLRVVLPKTTRTNDKKRRIDIE